MLKVNKGPYSGRRSALVSLEGDRKLSFGASI